MQQEKSNLQKRIESGKPIVTAEIAPSASSDPAALRSLVKGFSGKVHALGISDNRDGVAMSAVAASAIAVSENVEPILHMTTRDRNRTALVSDFLGARALGVRNMLCTSGTHQTLHPFRAAKNVFDIDATILLQSLHNLGKNASIVGEENIDGDTSYCLGAVASPFADPIELQLPRLAQKIFVGAQFIVTEPVFDLDRFGLWWKEVTNRGLQEKAAFIAGIRILTSAETAKAFVEKRPLPLVPASIVERLTSKKDKAACRSEGIAVAQEIMNKLSSVAGLRGFEIVCDEDHNAALEVLASLKSKIG